ncbi:MAG: proton-conducting transporter membrane subunit [Polyangia bacterium]
MALLSGGASLSAILGRRDSAALNVGTASAVAASLMGAVASLLALRRGTTLVWRARLALPLGEWRVGIDPLSAFFALCICVVSGLAAVYGAGYLHAYFGKRRVAPAVVCFNLLLAAMLGVVLARDAVLFLLAWEAMSLSSFFLVTFDNDRDDVRRAGTTYLIASHVGVILLIALFALLARSAGTFDFAAMKPMGIAAAGLTNVAFWLALGGFGTKAGFWPVHIWLPDAHPAAPSHVSAVMSGVMIKMGIYGLLRVLPFLGPPPAWWGGVFILVGTVSGVAGVLHALAQHDLKRLLAYHSVENIGIIALGIGLGLLGQHYGNPALSTLGYAGALLHTLNHGLFKGLLFQGAGSVLHGSGTRHLESLGGLYRRMPATATTFLVGSVAISGLPPLNGFASEWLIYLGAFRAGATLPAAGAVVALVTLPALALIGGLAAACFVKVFGVMFLGQARSDHARHAHEVGLAMRAPMLAAAVACLAIGLWPAGVLTLVAPAAVNLSGTALPADLGPLFKISLLATVLVALIAALALLRARLLKGRPVAQAATWGCGYPHATARMQYTATSFADPVLAPFSSALHIRSDGGLPDGVFPAEAHYEKHVGDMAGERVLLPAWRRFLRAAHGLRVIQHGRMQLYLVYILATLVALVLWQLSGAVGR